jgi:hypothetical protein
MVSSPQDRWTAGTGQRNPGAKLHEIFVTIPKSQFPRCTTTALFQAARGGGITSAWDAGNGILPLPGNF